MPRKKLIYTHEYPYHITARSNNREWFYLPKHECWDVFSDLLTKISIRFHFQIHAFVLMDNHYHMIGTTSKHAPLSMVMEWFQRSANRIINDKAGRTNHLFGGPYKASLITSEVYYYHVLRYVYQNPLVVGLSRSCEEYSFSTLGNNSVPLSTPLTGIAALVPLDRTELLEYLNAQLKQDELNTIRKAIKRTKFQFPKKDVPTGLQTHN
ncbi:MAG: transposase [Bdellovibrionales bacterium]|nr:transposase [Bdellovibrionales bacterium]